jgi:glycine cleavage system H protein
MSELPNELRYMSSHEWVRNEGDGIATIGITDHAQDSLGDVVFVELPEVGATLSAGDEAGVVESVKAASDIYSPVSGEVIEINEALEDAPETINDSPYGDGWFYKVKMSDPAELEDLLDADGYREVTEE